MKILYINTFDPYQEFHGGATVTRKELEIISEIGEVTTLFGQPLRRRKYFINPFRFLRDILSGDSIKLASYCVLHRPPKFYEKFDLIFCNHDFSAYDYRLFRTLKKPFIVRKHNAEHAFFREDALLQRIERAKIKYFEEELGRFSSATVHLSSSEFLADNYSNSKYHLFPPLISDELLLATPSSNEFYRHSERPIDILCVTNYEWGPNKEGFDWFFDKVAPHLDDKFSIHLIGKGSDRYAGRPSVTSYGYMEDISKFYKTAKVFIAPILSGAGIKIKNLEAIIYGVPIVTTPVGVDGLSDLMGCGGATVVTSPEEFAQELRFLLGNEGRCIEQRNIATNWVQKNVVAASRWRSQVKSLIERAVIS